MFVPALFSLFLLSSVPLLNDKPIGNPLEPTFNLNAIRLIACDEGIGTGFLIGDDIVATAEHVSSLSNCVDVASGNRLKSYLNDKANDFGLMTGVLPRTSYFKTSCTTYKKGRVYSAYGISSFMSNEYILRSVSVMATGTYKDVTFRDGSTSKGLSVLTGYNVQGMSGGPIVDIQTGKVVGIVNAGVNGLFGIPVGVSYSYELSKTPLCNKALQTYLRINP
jgi:hypothetical protein